MRITTLLLAVLGSFLLLSPAQAGPIDDAMLARAPKLFRELKAKGYQNVGILKFRVEKGGRPATFHAGPLNNNMALRLEECLIRVNDENKPIGVTHGASAIAAEADGKLSYLTPEGRKKLLTLSYPLAWGSERVKVDAFLTGLVQISPDYKKTVIRIQFFDNTNPELQELMNFEVKTDANVLTDAGESFNLKEPKIVTRGELSGLAKAFDGGAPPLQKAEDKKETPPPVPPEENKPPQNRGNDTPPEKGNTGTPKPSGKGDGSAMVPPEKDGSAPSQFKSDPSAFKKAVLAGEAKVQVDIYYDDKLVQPMFDPHNPGELMIPAPGISQKVHFVLKNLTSERLGVVLRINGINTLYKEADDRDVRQYAKWILEPKKTYTVAGFYPNPNTLEQFRIRPPDDSKREEMGNVAQQGLIQVDYFQESTAEDAEPPAVRRSVSLRKLSHPELAAKKPATLAELRSRMRGLGEGLKTRNLIVAGEKQSTELKESSFDHPLHAGSLTIRYYQPKR
jgi:hypothetical protein